MLLLLVAFLGGVLTVLSPCVLPVLPVLLSGTVGGRGRPLGIIAGFIGSFVLLTLFLASVVSALNLSPDLIRWVATFLLLGFGLTLAVPALQHRFELAMSRSLPQRRPGDRDGFLGGVLVGVILSALFFARKVSQLSQVTHTDSADGTRTYRVQGQLFFVSTHDFLHQFDFTQPARRVVIDLTDAHFWDGSAVGALDKVMLKFRRLGTPAELIGLNGASATLIDRLAVYDKPGALDRSAGH